jgi:arylsulfatase A-like enzyme
MGCQQSTEQKTSREGPPNIVYIIADDLGYGDVGFNGQEKISTPNIDQLAKKGLVFTQHYSGTTVCAPSRSSLITGMHTGHTPVRGNYEIQPEGQYPLPDTVNTLFKVMKKAGYVTGAFGKWGLGYPRSEGDPSHQSVDVFYGYNCQRMGHNYFPYHLWSNRDSVVLEGNKGQGKEQYGPHLIHEQTLQFIEDYQDSSFFLYVPTIIPHAELVVPDSLMENYRGKFGKETPFKGVDEGPLYKLGGYMSQEEPRAAFAAMVELLDRQVGEIVDKLEELGLSENTLIVFTSDNGPHLEAGADPDYFNSNGPFRGYKRDLYEGGIHVPMLAYWPGKIQAGKSGHISSFWDILPTFADLIGVESDPQWDGISFLPTLLQEKEQKEHPYLYWEFVEQGGKQAVRKGKWKAVRLGVKTDSNSPIELYDLESDPGEQENLAAGYPEVIGEMKGIMKEAHIPNPVFPLFQKRGVKYPFLEKIRL